MSSQRLLLRIVNSVSSRIVVPRSFIGKGLLVILLLVTWHGGRGGSDVVNIFGCGRWLVHLVPANEFSREYCELLSDGRGIG